MFKEIVEAGKDLLMILWIFNFDTCFVNMHDFSLFLFNDHYWANSWKV